MRMTGGTIIVTEQARGISEELSDVELSFAWPSIARSFGATGRFTWRGEVFDASANAGDLLAALSGDRSGLKLRLAGAPFKLAFDGRCSQQPSFKMEGTLAIDGKSLREAMRWAGRQPLPGGGIGRFALKAQTSFTGGMAIVLGVNIELDGNVAEGVLAVATEPRVHAEGHACGRHARSLPLCVDIRGAPRERPRLEPRTVRDRQSGRTSISTCVCRRRASRSRTRGSGAPGLRSICATAVSRSRSARRRPIGGVLKGALMLAKTETGADVKSQLQFTDVDLEICLGELFASASSKARAISRCRSRPPATAWWRSHARWGHRGTARQGAITGFNVEQLLKRLEQRPLSIGGDFRRGRTPFEQLTVTSRSRKAWRPSRTCGSRAAQVRLALGGSASIPARDLDLRGTAALVSASADAPPVFELPFVVQGSWDDPIMLPDAQSLISARPPRPAARRGARPQDPRCGAVRDRAADRGADHRAGRRSTAGRPALTVPDIS